MQLKRPRFVSALKSQKLGDHLRTGATATLSYCKMPKATMHRSGTVSGYLLDGHHLSVSEAGYRCSMTMTLRIDRASKCSKVHE